MRILLVLVIFQMFVACGDPFEADFVRTKTWSYDGGFKISEGDFVIFENEERVFKLKGDTICYNGKPRAIVKSINKSRSTMTVRSLDGKESGTYIDFDRPRE